MIFRLEIQLNTPTMRTIADIRRALDEVLSDLAENPSAEGRIRDLAGHSVGFYDLSDA